MNAIKYLFLLAAATLVSACGNTQPTCAGQDTQDLLKQVFYETAEKVSGLDAGPPGWVERLQRVAKFSVATIRTSSANEKTAKVSCEGTLELQFPEGVKNGLIALGAYKNVKVVNATGYADIEYTAQVTDDKKQLLVQMSGHTNLAEAAGIMGRLPNFEQYANNLAKPVIPSTDSAKPIAPVPPSATIESKATSEGQRSVVATLAGLQCGDYCHLRYKTDQGEERTALCDDAPICLQWTNGQENFKKHIGSRAMLLLRPQFVPESGETVDSIRGLEWR